MTLTAWEAAARQFEPTARTWATPGDLARVLTPGTVQTPALDLIDAELVRLLDETDGRLIISMPPQEGKSTRAGQIFPIWALTQNNDLRIVTGSYAQGLANRNGRRVRNLITAHPETELRIASDNGAVSEWEIAGKEGGMLSVGRGAGINGRPADLMIIDDPLKDRKEADSQVIRDACWDWWTDSLSARLAPGAPVVLIMTRWHEDDLSARLLDKDAHAGWRLLNIPAQADHKPEKGETDPLGREPGQYMVSARGRTFAQWELRRKTAGSRAWASLYQGRPAPLEGDILKRDWWQRFDHDLHFVRDDGVHIVTGHDDLIMSWDLTFKDTKSSDYVVGQVWMRRDADAYLLDQVRGQWDFPETVRQFQALTRRWPQATLKLVEDKANGPAVIASLRNKIPGIVPEEPQGSKEARASAIAPLVEAGNVWLPETAWADDLIEECAAFPNAVNDDMVDALSQGLNRLVLQPLLAGDLEAEHPADAEVEDEMSYLTTYL